MFVPATKTKDFKRTTFGPRSRVIARALAEALFSPDGEVTPEKLDAFVVEFDAYVSPASKTLRFGLLLLLFVLRWSPLLYFRFRTFEEMPLEERMHHLERLEKSKVGQLALVVISYKTMMSMVFYEDEAELRGLGYPGPERHRWRRALPQAQV